MLGLHWRVPAARADRPVADAAQPLHDEQLVPLTETERPHGEVMAHATSIDRDVWALRLRSEAVIAVDALYDAARVRIPDVVLAADAEYVLRWLRQIEAPENIIALQERVCGGRQRG